MPSMDTAQYCSHTLSKRNMADAVRYCLCALPCSSSVGTSPGKRNRETSPVETSPDLGAALPAAARGVLDARHQEVADVLDAFSQGVLDEVVLDEVVHEAARGGRDEVVPDGVAPDGVAPGVVPRKATWDTI